MKRLKRYKIFYMWKSLNRLTPSLGLEWTGTNFKGGQVLKILPLEGNIDRLTTYQLKSIKYEGVKLFNVIPGPLKV